MQKITGTPSYHIINDKYANGYIVHHHQQMVLTLEAQGKNAKTDYNDHCDTIQRRCPVLPRGHVNNCENPSPFHLSSPLSPHVFPLPRRMSAKQSSQSPRWGKCRPTQIVFATSCRYKNYKMRSPERCFCTCPQEETESDDLPKQHSWSFVLWKETFSCSLHGFRNTNTCSA